MSDVITECVKALENTDWDAVDKTVEALRTADRIFCVVNGGGYAHAMHFAADLRKIAGKQAFSFDNIAELTARINDQSWEDSGREWLAAHRYDPDSDIVCAFSCGGR